MRRAPGQNEWEISRPGHGNASHPAVPAGLPGPKSQINKTSTDEKQIGGGEGRGESRKLAARMPGDKHDGRGTKKTEGRKDSRLLPARRQPQPSGASSLLTSHR